MSQAHRRWLAGEMPALLSKGVLSQESYENLREHFDLDKPLSQAQGWSKMTIVLAAIGGLLIGGGIIMILAHNWDQMTRGSRMILAIAPLLISQVLVLLGLFPKQRGPAWREASAALMFCTVPASIALVGQSYHISNDFQSFQTLWFLLLLPFTYLLRAKLVAVFMMLLAMWIAALHQGDYWLFSIALLPLHFLIEPFGRQQSNIKIGWIFAIGVSFSIFVSQLTFSQISSFSILIFMSGAASIYLLGGICEVKSGFWQRPFTNIGAISITLNLLSYTFVDIWENGKADALFTFETQVLAELLLPVATIVGLGLVLRKRRTDLLPLSLAIGLCWVFVAIPVSDWQPSYFSLSANILMFCLGVWYLWQGINTQSSSQMNFGLLLIFLIILFRFFDQDFSFIVKGLVFITMGCCFIGLNLWQKPSLGTKS